MTEQKHDDARGASRSDAVLYAEPYLIDFSIKHNGWCIFTRKGDMMMEFHAGAFSERATAQSECNRLNDLAANAEARGAERSEASLSADVLGTAVQPAPTFEGENSGT